MKGFAIPLLGVIFVALISGSIQSTSADHLGPGEGIFSGEKDIELVTTEDSNYQVYLQAVIRNGDDQLISVIESTANGAYIPHKITAKDITATLFDISNVRIFSTASYTSEGIFFL